MDVLRRQRGKGETKDMKKNFKKVIALNLAIVVLAVVCYSDSLLGLRVSDPSILRAGLSILAGLALGAALIFGNYKLLSEPTTMTKEQLQSVAQVEAVLKKFVSSRYFGDISRTALDQISRFDASATRAVNAIHSRFTPGSLTGDRYVAVVDSARETAMENMKTIAARLSILSDEEYRRLLHYKTDDIPDDIQEKQLALYQKNVQFIRSSIAMNEGLVLKLDTLSLEVSASGEASAAETDALCEEITQLTEELKFYQ